jgi:hypothetical protein
MGDACGLRILPAGIHLFSPVDGQRIDWARP